MCEKVALGPAKACKTFDDCSKFNKKVNIINGNHNTLFGSISKNENKRDFAAYVCHK